MYYSNELVEEVRQSNDIVSVISQYIGLKRKGNNYFGLCPFHNEKSPSFSVAQDKQMYHCFGCNMSGNVITFLMEYEKYTFVEAIENLAERANIELPKTAETGYYKSNNDKKAKLLEINKEAAKFYCKYLKVEAGKLGYKYLKNRNLDDDIITQFGLGYASQYSNSLLNYLKSKDYSVDELKEAGLVNIDDRHGAYDKFFNRVIFPIQDVNNKVIGFGGRVMGDGKPKYLNSPETMIFDKSRNLYGLNLARTSRKSNIIVCEGYMDVIALHQAGFNQSVASLGTALTPGQANLLKRYTKDILLIYDSDDAGIKATMRAIPIFREVGIATRVVSLKPYKDPDEFISKLGGEEFQKRLDEASNSFIFTIDVIRMKYDINDPEQKTRFYNEVSVEIAKTFTEELERENYLHAAAKHMMVDIEMLKKLVIKMATVQPYNRPKPLENSREKIKNRDEASDKTQRLLITYICEYPEIYSQINKYINESDFVNPLYAEVAKYVFDDIREDKLNPARVIGMFQEAELQKKVSPLFHTKIGALETKIEIEAAIMDIIYKVKKQSIEQSNAELEISANSFQEMIKNKQLLDEIKKISVHLEV